MRFHSDGGVGVDEEGALVVPPEAGEVAPMEGEVVDDWVESIDMMAREGRDARPERWRRRWVGACAGSARRGQELSGRWRESGKT